MTFILLALELYFAVMLGVSGLAKMEHPDRFADTLRLHRILPEWSIKGVSLLFPWFETLLAAVLIAGVAARVTASIVLGVFLLFLLIESILVVTKRATECGCYGVAFRQKVDGASIAVSTILVILAIIHLGMILAGVTVPWSWRLPILLFLMGASLWLFWRIRIRRKLYGRIHAATRIPRLSIQEKG